MMSASEGEGSHEKADSCVNFLSINQIQMRTRREGVKKILKFCGCHIWKLPKE